MRLEGTMVGRRGDMRRARERGRRASWSRGSNLPRRRSLQSDSAGLGEAGDEKSERRGARRRSSLPDRTFADNYRTPHTTQMHVIERWKLSADGNSIDVSVDVDRPGDL
jgi:hypothetical protein